MNDKALDFLTSMFLQFGDSRCVEQVHKYLRNQQDQHTSTGCCFCWAAVRSKVGGSLHFGEMGLVRAPDWLLRPKLSSEVRGSYHSPPRLHFSSQTPFRKPCLSPHASFQHLPSHSTFRKLDLSPQTPFSKFPLLIPKQLSNATCPMPTPPPPQKFHFSSKAPFQK